MRHTFLFLSVSVTSKYCSYVKSSYNVRVSDGFWITAGNLPQSIFKKHFRHFPGPYNYFIFIALMALTLTSIYNRLCFLNLFHICYNVCLSSLYLYLYLYYNKYDVHPFFSKKDKTKLIAQQCMLPILYYLYAIV